jgi:hypothetical protein
LAVFSSGMSHRVFQVGTDISEWRIHSLKMEEMCLFETFAAAYPIAWHRQPTEWSNLLDGFAC